mmetsp:Transcript_133227/g.385535  ORF Transcript_133227/g.385535 Transcript_133227/m.385535 type:complete len:355 (-) Transcript_133227:38-1102(-)
MSEPHDHERTSVSQDLQTVRDLDDGLLRMCDQIRARGSQVQQQADESQRTQGELTRPQEDLREPRTSPWRSALVEERASELAAAAAAADVARSEAAAGSWCAALAADRAVAAAVEARHRRSPTQAHMRLGQPRPGQWRRMEAFRHVVDGGSSPSGSAGRSRSLGTASQPASPKLPKPMPFPQSHRQVVDFSRPDIIGARRYRNVGDMESRSVASRTGPPISQATSAVLSQTGPHYFGAPLSDAGWSPSSVRQVALCRDELLRRPLACDYGAAELSSHTSQGRDLSAPFGVPKSASQPDFGASSRGSIVSGPACVASESPPTPMGKADLMRKCWIRSRSLIRASRAAVQQGPMVK